LSCICKQLHVVPLASHLEHSQPESSGASGAFRLPRWMYELTNWNLPSRCRSFFSLTKVSGAPELRWLHLASSRRLTCFAGATTSAGWKAKVMGLDEFPVDVPISSLILDLWIFLALGCATGCRSELRSDLRSDLRRSMVISSSDSYCSESPSLAEALD
jgi:hypothetical protein